MIETRITGDNLKIARKLLNDVVGYLNDNNIDYHLEGGTLLGFVRDGEFLEWDHDIDISIPQKFAEKFYRKRVDLWLKGYRISSRISNIDIGPISKGEYRIFKVKRLYFSFLSMFSARIRNNMLVADIFVKFDDGNDTYWIAKETVMKSSSDHYRGYEEIDYDDNKYRIPLKYQDYLTHKYGDWSVPIKDWDCGLDEKSIVSKVPRA